MLSLLQRCLGKTPVQPEPQTTRQEEIEPAFSCTNARNALKDDFSTPSLTTGTSLTDAASETNDVSAKPEKRRHSSRNQRNSISSYNENVLSGSATLTTCKRLHLTGGARSVSGETLVNRNNDSRDRLLQRKVKGLDGDWNVGATSEDGLRSPVVTPKHQARRRRPTRLKMIDQVTSLLEFTSAVLGKRKRETIEAGLEDVQGLAGNKRVNLGSTELRTLSFADPSHEKDCSSEFGIKDEGSTEPGVSRRSAKKPSKRWLSQGLYVGQDRDFDPRLTESKNKLRNASTKQADLRQQSVMPLPMFAGQRTLEIGRNFRLPWDIFAPLPPGQPRPNEWKKTQKNVFIGDAVNVWKKSKSLEHSTCICTPATGCDEHCFNRFMLYECDDSNCNVGAAQCTNRSFAALKKRCKAGDKYNIGVEVMKTFDRGYGIRANRTFEPNQIIVEYTGEVITQDECDERMNKRYKDAECYYLMDFDQSMILDATRGSIARFVNHSCEPNCRMIKWTVAGKPRMALFAGDNGIMTGEELTYDYNFNPYSIKNVQECRCGAAGCRGVLGPKPKEPLKPITTIGKKELKQVVKDAVETVNKRRQIAVQASVMTAFASGTAQTPKTLLQKRFVASSAVQSEKLNKKGSQHSLRGLDCRGAVERPDSKTRRHRSITYARRRNANGTFANKRLSVENGFYPGTQLAEAKQEVTPAVKKKDGAKSVASAKENLIKTVRRSSRGTPGNTVRVIGDDEFKGFR